MIDEVAVAVGLKFIVNTILNAQSKIVGIAAGDPVEAHVKGAGQAKEMHTVKIPQTAEIVVADGYPFDIEFWQVNKALDTAGLVVNKGGVVIIVSPCYEGISATHPEIIEYGYQNPENIQLQCFQH